jgi:HEAT repeat protein
MKRFLICFMLVALFLGASVIQAMALDVDRYIKELKSPDPKVRANAAYELGCG